MSIQDNIFDIEAALENTPESKLFDELVTYIGQLEKEIDVLYHDKNVLNEAFIIFVRENLNEFNNGQAEEK